MFYSITDSQNAVKVNGLNDGKDVVEMVHDPSNIYEVIKDPKIPLSITGPPESSSKHKYLV